MATQSLRETSLFAGCLRTSSEIIQHPSAPSTKGENKRHSHIERLWMWGNITWFELHISCIWHTGRHATLGASLTQVLDAKAASDFKMAIRNRSDLNHCNFSCDLCSTSYQRKTKGQQLKGKIVSALFHTFAHIVRIFPPERFFKLRLFIREKRKRPKLLHVSCTFVLL